MKLDTNSSTILELAAGTGTKAPLKFNSGTLMATAVAGAVEFKGYKNMKHFDITVGNPPYQAQKDKEHEGRGKCGTSLWDKFVKKSLDFTKDNGYICLVHPSRWRTPKNKLGIEMRTKQIKYLEIHGVEDGLKTFGCQSRYDWYVMQNCCVAAPTTIVDQEGTTINLNLSVVPFIPNAQIEKVMGLVAKDGEKAVDLLWDCQYHTQTMSKKGTMQKEQNHKFQHICVYSIDRNGNPTFWHSSVKHKEHFVPKVIFPGGAFQSVGCLIDAKGEFGLTQFAKGIVDTVDNLPFIYKALMSKEFKKFYRCFAMATTELDKDVISLFRKDFWKEFI